MWLVLSSTVDSSDLMIALESSMELQHSREQIKEKGEDGLTEGVLSFLGGDPWDESFEDLILQT